MSCRPSSVWSWAIPFAGVVLIVVACQQAGTRTTGGVSAQFGVFFGGQVQRLERIALEPDTTKQRQGFVLRRSPSDSQRHSVAWEITTAPEKAVHVDSWGERRPVRSVLYGEAEWSVSEEFFERELSLGPRDPVGLWNARVEVDQRLVLDHSFTIFRPTGP